MTIRRRRVSKREKERWTEEELGKKLLGYSVAAGAVLAVATNADAVLIKTAINETAYEGEPVRIDLNGDSEDDFEVYIGSFGIRTLDGGLIAAASTATFPLVHPFYQSNSVQAPVGGMFAFVNNAALSVTGPFYAGLQLGSNFGFVGLSVHHAAMAVNVMTLGYQTTAGGAAHVESIPEPGTLALLATGAAGLMALRRRQRREEPEAGGQS